MKTILIPLLCKVAEKIRKTSCYLIKFLKIFFSEDFEKFLMYDLVN